MQIVHLTFFFLILIKAVHMQASDYTKQQIGEGRVTITDVAVYIRLIDTRISYANATGGVPV